MTTPYRYRRGVGGELQKSPAGDTAARAGELIALPGKKHRTYRAPVTLDANNKPVRTSLVDVRRKKQPQQQSLDWVTVFGDMVKGDGKGP
jgi:hypothetical protein